MVSTRQVYQILVKAVCVSFCGNALGKIMNPSLLSQMTAGQTGTQDIGTSTDLGKGKLPIQTNCYILIMWPCVASCHDSGNTQRHCRIIFENIRGSFNKWEDSFYKKQNTIFVQKFFYIHSKLGQIRQGAPGVNSGLSWSFRWLISAMWNLHVSTEKHVLVKNSLQID